MTRDSCRLFGIEGAWPEFFCPEEENCALCGSTLGPVSNHPGQRSADSYLITELNPLDIKVKTCTSKDCLAMHQWFPVDIGKCLYEKNVKNVHQWHVR